MNTHTVVSHTTLYTKALDLKHTYLHYLQVVVQSKIWLRKFGHFVEHEVF